MDSRNLIQQNLDYLNRTKGSFHAFTVDVKLRIVSDMLREWARCGLPHLEAFRDDWYRRNVGTSIYSLTGKYPVKN